MMLHHGARVSAILIALAVYSGCGGQDEDAVRLKTTFNTLISALQKGDAGALWDLCDKPTHIYFNDLASEMRAVHALVEAAYPPDERNSAKQAIGGDLLKRADSGRDLFIAMVDSSRIAAPSDPQAREVDRVVVGAYTATVITKAGKSVEFSVGDDGSFRTGGFMKAFLKQPALSTLKDNLATARKNCAVYSREKQGARSGGGKR